MGPKIKICAFFEAQTLGIKERWLSITNPLKRALWQLGKGSISLRFIPCSLLDNLVTVCINKITRRALIMPGSLAAFQPMLTEAKYTCSEGRCAVQKLQHVCREYDICKCTSIACYICRMSLYFSV